MYSDLTSTLLQMSKFTEGEDEGSTGRYEKGRQAPQSDLEANEPVFEHKGSDFR